MNTQIMEMDKAGFNTITTRERERERERERAYANE